MSTLPARARVRYSAASSSATDLKTASSAAAVGPSTALRAAALLIDTSHTPGRGLASSPRPVLSTITGISPPTDIGAGVPGAGAKKRRSEWARELAGSRAKESRSQRLGGRCAGTQAYVGICIDWVGDVPSRTNKAPTRWSRHELGGLHRRQGLRGPRWWRGARRGSASWSCRSRGTPTRRTRPRPWSLW